MKVATVSHIKLARFSHFKTAMYSHIDVAISMASWHINDHSVCEGKFMASFLAFILLRSTVKCYIGLYIMTGADRPKPEVRARCQSDVFFDMLFMAACDNALAFARAISIFFGNLSMHETSIADEIDQIEMGRPHVVLLGAGASRAGFPSGDANGMRLPLMNDFADIVPVGRVLTAAGISHVGRNFEKLYSELCTDSSNANVRAELERVIFKYFSSLSLPPNPTLYDHLILSLRKKDVVATFNWDPFLIQAIRRNHIAQEHTPRVLFLHGNVAAGYCARDNVQGVFGLVCSRCGAPFESSNLLYPVAAKKYEDDPAIAVAWREVKRAFESAFMVTIFGYGAPDSDASAIKLLREAWGGNEKRVMEQFEIIDVRSEDELLKTWKPFIHSHHYEVHSNVYESWLFNHPRRSGEAYMNQYINAKFIGNNPVPQGNNFDGLWEWFKPLIERERNAA